MSHGKIYTPKKDEEYIAPFGPVMGYKKMSPSFLQKMNELMSPNLEDWSDSLVGKVWCSIIHPVVYAAGKIKGEA